jgi:futalosine hydrolase
VKNKAPRVLIVSATRFEIDKTTEAMTEIFEVKKWWKQYQYADLQIDTLITGIGPAMASFYTPRAFSYKNYDLAINAGVAGSFSKEYRPGSLAWVCEDQFGDLGVTDGEGFYTLFEKNLVPPGTPPFNEGKLEAECPEMLTLPEGIKKARAITVSNVSGEAKQIETRKEKFACDLESMEGAAFMYACHAYHIPCLQLRAVSNMITAPRDETRWALDKAIEQLNKALIEILDKL